MMAHDDLIIRCPYAVETLVVAEESFVRTIWTAMNDQPDRLAVVEVDGERRRVTHFELMNRAESVAVQLLNQGCQLRDVIAIFAPNSVDWIVVALAALRIGATVAAISALLTPGELQHHLRVCCAKYVFTSHSLANQTVQVARSLNTQVFVMGGGCAGCVNIALSLDSYNPSQSAARLPTFDALRANIDQVSVILFSSGTTGPSKGVMLSDRFLQYQLRMMIHPKCSFVSKVQLLFTPMSHGIGFFITFLGLAIAATSFVMTKFDLNRFLNTLHEQQIEHVMAVPPLVSIITKSSHAQHHGLADLKDLLVGGAPLKADVEQLLLNKYPQLQLRQVFGMTEVGTVTAVPYEEHGSPPARKAGTIGVPLLNIIMKVIDTQTGESLRPGRKGELCIKSPAMMLGYANDPEATAATIDSDGWLHTGDLAYYDEDGYLFIVDRLKELIKYNAFQVPPAELESVLLSHPDVADAGVVGSPDPAAGELPLAWVVRKPTATVNEQQLRQFVDERVAAYKRLRGGVHFVSSIPRTASGKILRRQMRDSLATMMMRTTLIIKGKL